MRHRLSKENIVYLAIWGLLAAAPILSEAYELLVHHDNALDWSSVVRAWYVILPFAIAFVLHNWLLAPRLVYDNRRTLYISCLVALMALFMVYQCTQRPSAPEKPSFEEHVMPPSHPERMDEAHGPHPHHRPPAIVGQHDIVSGIILLLMLGMNLGTKLYFKQRRDEQISLERERQHLQQQLEYLKYQINPHFLMNTLNNIHALIDINPAEAQQTIIDLSHLLRFVLYEGAKPTVLLSREVQFVCDYITLMRQRLSDTVTITLDRPTLDIDPQVPPMLLITFVENAFKHGVSYRYPTYVNISIALHDQRLHFDCRNSRRPEGTADDGGGVGLQNVRQRLDILFPGNYILDIDDQSSDYYAVHLEFPLT